MMAVDPGSDDVRAIVNTLLVPMDPPNRSQWRKLELAMKFINISKQSVANSKRLNQAEQKSNRQSGEKKNQNTAAVFPRIEKRPLHNVCCPDEGIGKHKVLYIICSIMREKYIGTQICR